MGRRAVNERRHLDCPGCGLTIMERYAVTSSNIAAIGWEPDADGASEGVMEVEFNGGQVYQYRGVPSWLYREFLHSPSPGRFLKANIVSAYQGDRIE
jgi:hypothetical protein